MPFTPRLILAPLENLHRPNRFYPIPYRKLRLFSHKYQGFPDKQIQTNKIIKNMPWFFCGSHGQLPSCQGLFYEIMIDKSLSSGIILRGFSKEIRLFDLKR
jgi:hypothetical protein